jgi:hypothetical protein
MTPRSRPCGSVAVSPTGVVGGSRPCCAESDADVDDLAAGPLRRFPVLGLYRVADLEEAGFEVAPTFRAPHVTIAFTGELDDGLERLRAAIHEQRTHPYHERGPDEEVNP